MSKRILLGSVACLAIVSLMVGCGGNEVAGGGDPPPAPADAKYVFRIDFANDTVTVIEEKMVDANPGGGSAEMELDMTVVLSEDGTLGRRHVDATVTNSSSGAIGVNREGVVTGVDLCVDSLDFEEGDGTPVDGGGMAGAHAWNAQTELPVFRIPEQVAVGATSSVVQLDFILPRNAEVAVVGIVVRADTERHQTFRPRRAWVSTVAGRSDETGHVNGPVARARFHFPYGLYYREAEGDLLVPDYSNDAVRRIADGVVTDHINGFGGVGGPIDAALDAEGNIVVCCYSEHRIYLSGPAGGSSPTVIAGTGANGFTNGPGNLAQFSNPWGIAVLGDDVYVADRINQAVRKIHYEGGGRFVAANYTVSTDYGAPGTVRDVAFDHLGNMFIAVNGNHQIRMKPRDSGTAHVIAGTGVLGSNDGLGNVATFRTMNGIAICPDGTLYLTEHDYCLRRIRYLGGDMTQATSWRVDTLLEHGTPATDGDEGDATCKSPQGIWVAEDGTVWFADDQCIRRMDLRVN